MSVCNQYTAAIGANGTDVQVCVRNEPLAFVLLAIYLILTIVLLLNLLIAILKSVTLATSSTIINIALSHTVDRKVILYVVLFQSHV